MTVARTLSGPPNIEGAFMTSRHLSAILIAVAIPLGSVAHALERIAPPAVPTDIQVQAGFKPFLVAHATGTQNYICALVGVQYSWVFIGPQATLFNSTLQQVLTHFHSTNPSDSNAIQATWQHSRDSSRVWAVKFTGSTDAAYVAPDAIEWLLLEVKGAQLGPTGGAMLMPAKFIQRINTSGGLAPPAADCTAGTIKSRRLVPYEADYYFYK
jgi:hypothetical protein